MMTPGKGGWGLGLEVAGQGDGLHVFHTGSGDGFRAILVGFPERGDGAVILVNGDSGGDLRYEILRSLAREYGWPAFGSVERAAIPVDPAAVREWTGTYTFSDGSTIDISLDNRRVFARWKDLLPVEVFPASDTLFFNLSNEEYVFSREGEAPTLTWRGSFGEFTATRRP